MSDASALYTVDELARMLGRSAKRIYALALEGSIPCIRLGRAVEFPRAMIDRWLAGEPVESAAAKPAPAPRMPPRRRKRPRARLAVARSAGAERSHDHGEE